MTQWALNAIRAQMEQERLDSSLGELISLDGIMMKLEGVHQSSVDNCEAYVMLDGCIDSKDDHESSFDDKTLIVNRANLQFNNK